jgi:hypothetical protein
MYISVDNKYRGVVKMKFKELTVVFFLLIALFAHTISAQDFKKSVLIDIPGNNKNFCLLSTMPESMIQNAYIIWINERDSLYSVMLKQLSPVWGENVVLCSDRIPKSNPIIAENWPNNNFKIMWQQYNKEGWSIVINKSDAKKLTGEPRIIDSSLSAPQAAMNGKGIAWIKNKTLYAINSDDSLFRKTIIDSADCSLPVLPMYGNIDFSQVFYLKQNQAGNGIYYAQNYNGQWRSTKDKAGKEFGKVSLGIGNASISFPELVDSVWKIGYQHSGYVQYSSNISYNCFTPVIHTHSISKTRLPKMNETPFFIAYAADSLKGNKEIFLEKIFSSEQSQPVNISDAAGDDENLRQTFFTNNGTEYIALVWEHTENGKTDIWMAKDFYDSGMDVEKENNPASFSFNLKQNYPNPFNPSTVILYDLQKEGRVVFSVYNCLGKLISRPVDEFKCPGAYKVNFNGSELSSGVYFYELEWNDFKIVKSMLLIK